MKARPLAAVAAALVVVALLAPAAHAHGGSPPPPLPTGDAGDGPGDVSHFNLARKDCVGTARNRGSKVWYTIADGVLSDVYFPTNDNTNVETLQYVVTDGSSFTDLQTRDMTYTVQTLDRRALGCRVTATAKSGRYKIVTDYVTDPKRETVVMDARLIALKGKRSDLKLYVRLDPTLNGNGGGQGGLTSPGEEGDNAGADSGTVVSDHGHNVLAGSDPVTETIAANRDYAVPVYSALNADRPFRAVSNGFAGKDSDGLIQLDASRRLTSTFKDATGGNLVQTAQVDLGEWGDFELALGFGDSQAGALRAARRSLDADFHHLERGYVDGWQDYARKLVNPRRPRGVASARWNSLLDEYYLSAFYVKAAEDKTFPGAVAAALASPWGQALSAGSKKRDYFGSYREVFARDLYEAWTAVFLAGDTRTARDMTRFLFERQQLSDGSMPRNSLPNGKEAPDSFNTQLDECSYPLIMALAVGLTGRDYYEAHIKPAANFVASHGPSFGPERWEEQPGFSPSTIASEIAGLLAAAKIADRNGDRDQAGVWRGVADEFQRNLKKWTLTTTGPLGTGRYFIRLSPTGDPNAARSYDVGNNDPPVVLDQRNVIDAGFLEYVRLGVMAESDPDIAASLQVVDDNIRRSTPSGDGFLRYTSDGYGDRRSDGRPWAPTGKGNGHLWPVLAGERGQFELDRGTAGAAVARLEAMRNMSSGVGLIGEQAWEVADLARSPFGSNPATASIGFENGKPAGSAAALTWSAGQFVRLMLDTAAGDVLDRPDYTVDRYVRRTQGQTTLTVTGPADRTIVTSPVTVTGTSAPGNTIRIAATNVDEDSKTSVFTGRAASDGSFSIDVELIGGRSVLNIVATSPSGATALATRTVVVLAATAPVIFEANDPDNDDRGPGNYRYPTDAAFHDGAFDIEQFQVLDTPDTLTFRVRLRDLTPTFGSPLGAQLLDVYIHDPAATTTSTAASFPQRNYRIAAGGAWSRLLEVQGFGQRFIDANGDTPPGASIRIRADDISRYITFRVARNLIGTPGPGWGFTVVLTSQDGFSGDQARGFQRTAEPFQLGQCPAATADPHCTFPLDKLPKAMDVLTPAGVSQADELDYTLSDPDPVTLQPVTIP